jgi:hypothetical protein
MGAPRIAQQVYRAHIEHYGEPDDSIVYDDAKHPAVGPARVDVMIWLANKDLDVTTFSTIGMCTEPMEGTTHRAELHFAIRCRLEQKELRQCSLFLANLASYPFHHQTHFDWWHRLQHSGAIPLFPSASAILFHPRLVSDGWDTMQTDEGEVKILNVVPLNAREARLNPVSAIPKMWEDEGVDILLPR